MKLEDRRPSFSVRSYTERNNVDSCDMSTTFSRSSSSSRRYLVRQYCLPSIFLFGEGTDDKVTFIMRIHNADVNKGPREGKRGSAGRLARVERNYHPRRTTAGGRACAAGVYATTCN